MAKIDDIAIDDAREPRPEEQGERADAPRSGPWHQDQHRLVEALQAGHDPDELFRLLFELYSRPIARFFKNRGFSDEECRELTQETFLHAHRGLDKFRNESSYKTWLYRIARNLWSNTVRSRTTHRRSAEVVSLDEMEPSRIDELEGSSSPGEEQRQGPLDRVIVQERDRLLRDALASLPARQQRLVLLQTYQGLNVREIAVIMKMPEGTVKSQLFRAREFLKRKLSDLYSGLDD